MATQSNRPQPVTQPAATRDDSQALMPQELAQSQEVVQWKLDGGVAEVHRKTPEQLQQHWSEMAATGSVDHQALMMANLVLGDRTSHEGAAYDFTRHADGGLSIADKQGNTLVQGYGDGTLGEGKMPAVHRDYFRQAYQAAAAMFKEAPTRSDGGR